MRLLSAYIFRTTVASIVVVLVVITALDLLAKLIDELGGLTDAYTFSEALFYVALAAPASMYQYMPFAGLVGGLVGLGGLASTSELVIMRAAGVSLLRITWCVIKPVLWFIALMLVFAEYVIPITDQYSENRRLSLLQGDSHALSAQSGLWNREGDEFMHFNRVQANGKLTGVTRYQYDSQRRLIRTSFAETVLYVGGQWQQENLVETVFTYDANNLPEVYSQSYVSQPWDTEISPDLLTIIVQDVDYLALTKLYQYASYLETQNLDNGKYLLAYWNKVLQPLVIISLVLVAVSFIFGPLREVTMGYRIFTGVVVGIVFQLSQKLLGPASLLYGIPPLFAVLLPIIVCLCIGWFLLARTR